MAKMFKELDRVMDASLAKLELMSRPEMAVLKKKLEKLMESKSELKANFLLDAEHTENELELTKKEIKALKDLVDEPEVMKDEF